MPSHPFRTIRDIENFGRTRLSKSFFMRDFLHSEISQIEGVANLPSDPELAIYVGRKLCEELLEPLQDTFGRIAIRSAYRSPEVNEIGNRKGYGCASNYRNLARHIWDVRDENGFCGATACIVIPWFADRYAEGEKWQAMAWWIHDHLPYSELCFYPRLCAFNIGWHEHPKRLIRSMIEPKGILTRPGTPNAAGDRDKWYQHWRTDWPLAVSSH